MDRAGRGVRQDRLPAARHRLCLDGRPEARHDRDQPQRLLDGDGDQRLQPDRRGQRGPGRFSTTSAAIATMTYFGGEKAVPGYNVMGICKAALDSAVKYLAFDLGPRGIRVNALSAGPLRTLAGRGAGVEDMLQFYEKMAPLGRNVTHDEVGRTGAFLLSTDSRRHHRRNPARRLRLQHHGHARPLARRVQEMSARRRGRVQIAIAVVEDQGRCLIGLREADRAAERDCGSFPAEKSSRANRRQRQRCASAWKRPAPRWKSSARIPRPAHDYEHAAVDLHFLACRLVEQTRPLPERFRWVATAELCALRLPRGQRRAAIAAVARVANRARSTRASSSFSSPPQSISGLAAFSINGVKLAKFEGHLADSRSARENPSTRVTSAQAKNLEDIPATSSQQWLKSCCPRRMRLQGRSPKFARKGASRAWMLL